MPGLAGGNTVTIRQCDHKGFPLLVWNQFQNALNSTDYKTVTLYAREFYTRVMQGWNQNDFWDPDTHCASAVKQEGTETLVDEADGKNGLCARNHKVWRGSRGR